MNLVLMVLMVLILTKQARQHHVYTYAAGPSDHGTELLNYLFPYGFSATPCMLIA